MPRSLLSLIAAPDARTALPAPLRRAEIRRRAGYSQRQLAVAIGVSRPTITRWENGTIEPRGAGLRAYGVLLRHLRDDCAPPAGTGEARMTSAGEAHGHAPG